MVRASLALAPLQIAVRAGEATLPLLLAAWFGRTRETDAYVFVSAAFALAAALGFQIFHDSALVPILALARAKGHGRVSALVGAVLARTLAYGGVAAGASIALFAGVVALRYQGAERTTVRLLAAALGVQLVAIAVRGLFATCLQAHHRYRTPAVASIVAFAVQLCVLVLAHVPMGIVSLALGALAGEIAAALVLYVALRRVVRFRPAWAIPPELGELGRLLRAEGFGSAIGRVNPLVDQLMASAVAIAGGGTLLRYAYDVATAPTSALQATLFPVLLAHLSEDAASGDVDRVRRTVARTVAVVAAGSAAIALLVYGVREPLLRLLFLHGTMDAGGVATMAAILPYHLLGLVPFATLLIATRAHVALRNGPIFMRLGVIGTALNLAGNVLLLPYLGLRGIALATSLTSAVLAAISLLALPRAPGERRLPNHGRGL